MAVDVSTPRRAPAETTDMGRLAGRSTAMWVVPVLAAIEVLLMLNVMRQAGLIPPLVVFSVLMALVVAGSIARPGTWTYLAAGVAFLALTAANGPILIDGPLHPVASDHQWEETVALVLGVSGIVAGFAAARESRRGRGLVAPFSTPLGEAAAILVAGVLVGSSLVSLTAYGEVQASPGAGTVNGVVSAPTQAPAQLTAQGSRFVDKVLVLHPGSGAVYVVNKDGSPHTFDIEVRGKHYSYPVPAGSTVGVVLDLDAGRYTYYCAISGHRANGMEGTLTVS